MVHFLEKRKKVREMQKKLMNEWAEEWLQYKKRYVKESTYANYLILMRNQILPRLGEKEVEKIDSKTVQEQVTYWSESGRLDGKGGLAQKTVKDIVIILKMCRRDYIKMYDCNMPVLEVEYPVSKKTNRLNVLSKEQQEYLLSIICEELEYETLGYALSLYTGIRIGELCALQWADIDMDNRSISVQKTLQRIYLKDKNGGKGRTKVIITSPKSAKAIREIPISDALYTLLNVKRCKDKSTYLLTGTKKYMEPRLYRRHYERFLKENSAEYIRFHGLRHTFATRCIESGADYKVVSELLGHASVNLTLNLYVHPCWEDKKRCVELI